ncbi:SusF/SusE family outer membrane protein [Flavivirga abyssicola]|uniref:SusE domain-containing protein n=1 Tax=Flavivirga abyssicola TaxID=3063533 RepID=UPI0026DEFD29|nr:SusF/SusE family outer membrane protein [Flavivirga sp. MEBiC07777]WVK13705.1 SusF/SusE family outer membrane protein [Flavivirga sp. MEBiC07777]
MKNIKIITLLIIALIGFYSCNDDDELVFTASEAEGLVFNTTFLNNYVLNSSLNSNLAERFTWGSADFDVPTEVSYSLEAATMADFSDYIGDDTIEDYAKYNLGTTTSNELPVTVKQMLDLAALAGLDNNPDTDEPNTGQLHFRIKAFIGQGSLESYSSVQTLSIELQETTETGGGAFEISSWGVVGSGYNNWAADGAPKDAPFYTTSTPGVIVSYVNLLDGEIKFREDNAWDNSLGDANVDGILDTDADNNIAVTAGDYKITIDTNDNSYTIEPFSWGVVGSGFNDWGNDGPDAKFYYDYTTDTFKTSVALLDGEIKFRMDNKWDVSFGDANGDNILDTDSDNNIASTAGHYLITLNLNDNTYSIESSNVYGVVGSGFNDWGNNGPDASLTEIQPGVWFAENITLLDGEVKFRQNNAWDVSYGDANADNILDTDSDNNIASTAGNYVISIDFNDPDGPKYLIGKRL